MALPRRLRVFPRGRAGKIHHSLAAAIAWRDSDSLMNYESFSLTPMLIGLSGGLALFLHGMTMMSNSMRAMAGSQLKTIMAGLAGNRLSALLTGIVITAIVQSSSVTSVIAIGFVSAGVLTLGQALVVIMGAAVGSTVTAQIIAFDISNLAFLLVAIGFGLSLWKARRIPSLVGTVILGLGVLFPVSWPRCARISRFLT
jgi:phosphate:Na+ symporter